MTRTVRLEVADGGDIEVVFQLGDSVRLTAEQAEELGCALLQRAGADPLDHKPLPALDVRKFLWHALADEAELVRVFGELGASERSLLRRALAVAVERIDQAG